MTGVIWIVQILHYPTFLKIEREKFQNFAEWHSVKITWIVAPLMVLEMLSSVILLKLFDFTLLPIVHVISIGFIWLATALLSVPCHNLLIGQGYNEEVIYKLIRTNWVRTVLWSLRSALVIYEVTTRLKWVL